MQRYLGDLPTEEAITCPEHERVDHHSHLIDEFVSIRVCTSVKLAGTTISPFSCCLSRATSAAGSPLRLCELFELGATFRVLSQWDWEDSASMDGVEAPDRSWSNWLLMLHRQCFSAPQLLPFSVEVKGSSELPSVGMPLRPS